METSTNDFKAALRAQGGQLARDRRSEFERWIQKCRQDIERWRTLLQGLAPFMEHTHNFKGVLLGDVFVGAGCDFAKYIIQWRARGIAGRKPEIREIIAQVSAAQN